MDVILPVAGLGTRLRPQTWSKPKPLVSLAGKPMLAHVLDRVMPLNPDRLIFITGFLGDQIEAWAKATYNLPMAFVEQPEMRGQTDAIIRTRHLVHGSALILFPDMLFEADWSILKETDADVVMFTKEVEDPSALGVAVVEHGRIVRLVEKPKEPVSRLAVIGIYWFRHMPDLYAAIDEQMARGLMLKNEYFIADAIQIMIDSATIERAVIGPYASIGAKAVVRDAVVRDAIVEEGATIECAVIEHSILGRSVLVRGRVWRLNIGDNSLVDA